MWCAAALAVTSLGLTVAAGQQLASLLGSFLLLLAALTAAGAIAAGCARYRLGAVEAELAGQIARERRAARELDGLHGLGWAVLHDRLLPGTEHRLAHVLAGPAGLPGPEWSDGAASFAPALPLEAGFVGDVSGVDPHGR